MKSIILKSALAMAVMAPAMTAFAEGEDKFPGYTLVFAEEFNGNAVDEEVWEFEKGFCRNHEDQYYQKDNAKVADGCLQIEARKERVRNEKYVKYSTDWKTKNQYADYTSSSIISRHSGGKDYAWGPGSIFEIRAKIPVATGYWPAIWCCGTKYEWPYNGEIDIMEYYGDAIHANVAWGGKNRWQAVWSSKAPRMSHFAPDFADHFHVWRMEWTEASIKIFLDDELLNETNLDRTVNPRTDWFPYDNVNPYRGDHKQYMWLNFALGGDNGGSLANTPLPATYYVDYVRVYKANGNQDDPNPDPDAYDHGLETEYNLLTNGNFESSSFSVKYPYDWEEMADFACVDGNLPGWELDCDVWNVSASVFEHDGSDEEYIFDTNKQYLHLQRYHENGWGDGTATQLVKSLNIGESYTLDAIVGWYFNSSNTPDQSHGFRVYEARMDNSKGNLIFEDSFAGTEAGWQNWSREFTAKSENIILQAYLSNPWREPKENDGVAFDIDNVRLYKTADKDKLNPNGSGIENFAVGSEANVPMEVYSIQGQRMNDDIKALPHGIYVIRQASKATKIII